MVRMDTMKFKKYQLLHANWPSPFLSTRSSDIGSTALYGPRACAVQNWPSSFGLILHRLCKMF
jgi:hypothetical protein